MSGSDAVAAIVVVVLVLTLYVTHRTPTSIAGDKSVATTTHTALVLPPEHADGDLTASFSYKDQDGIEHTATGDVDVRHGRVYQSDEQRTASDKAGFKFQYNRTVGLCDPYLFDLGTVAGAAGLSGADRFQVGLRYSPVRLLYGTVAPDLILTKDAVGVGVSAYLPADEFPNLSHWGLEVARLIPTHSGTKPANFVGIAFSTYDP
jgi:hypothetical protein